MWEIPTGSHLRRRNFTCLELATYAQRAVAQITQDSISTHFFAEWLGESNFSIAKPINGIKWATATAKWFIPTDTIIDFGPIHLDTSSFEAAVHRYHRVERKLGRTSMRHGRSTLLWDCLQNTITASEHLPHGLRHAASLKFDSLLLALEGGDEYEDGKKWSECANRGSMIQRYFETKGCPYFVSTYGGTYRVRENGEDRTAMAAVLWGPFMEFHERFEDLFDCW